MSLASIGTLSASQSSPSFLSCHGGRGDAAVANFMYFGEGLMGGGYRFLCHEMKDC